MAYIMSFGTLQSLYTPKQKENIANHDMTPLKLFNCKIVMWGRYIVDVLLIWSGSYSEFHRFHEYINGINHNLELSLEFL